MATNTEDTNVCSICLELFKEPKLIDCHHTFCLLCLEDYVKQFKSYYGNFPCPLCRRQINVPKDGVSSFTSNFYISTHTDINSCVHHKYRKAELYCIQCSDAVCGKCFAMKHNGHFVLDLDSETTLKGAIDQTCCLQEQLTTFKREVKRVVSSLDFKQSELHAATKIANDRIDARVEKMCTDAKQFGEQLRVIIIDISEKQQSKLDAVNVELQELSTDVETALKLSRDISSIVPVIQVLNTLKLSKDVIERQVPVIPEIRFPIFTKDCTNVVSSVTQIGHCNTAQEAIVNFTFNLEDLKKGELVKYPQIETIKNVTLNLNARYNKASSGLDLNAFLNIYGSDKPQSCYRFFSITVHSSVECKSATVTPRHELISDEEVWGFGVIDWDEIVDPENGYLDENNNLNLSATILTYNNK